MFMGLTRRWRGTKQELGISEKQFFNGILQFSQRCRVGSAQPLSSVVLTLALLTGGFGEGVPEFFPAFDFCFSLEAVYFVPFW